MIINIAHVCYRVSSLDQSIAFYCETLGLKKAFDFTNDHGERFGAYIRVGNRTFIELFTGDPKPADGQSYAHLCLEVDDMEATVAELKANGADVGEIKLGRDESYQAWLTDPDGNRIELHAYTPNSWQTPHL